MNTNKGSLRNLTLGQMMQLCDPKLRRIPKEILEEGMLRHYFGDKIVPAKQRLLKRAVDLVCEDPSSPKAADNLRKARDYVFIMKETDSEAVGRAIVKLREVEGQLTKGHAIAEDVSSTIEYFETRLKDWEQSVSSLRFPVSGSESPVNTPLARPRRIPPNLKKLKKELGAFLKNPSGPQAEARLAKVFEIVEHLPQGQKQEAAREVAEKLLAISGHLDKHSRNTLASVIRSGANPQSDIMRELGDMIQKSKPLIAQPLALNSEIILGWLNMNAQPETFPDSDFPDDRSHQSIIHLVHEDRNGQLREVRTIPKKAYEQMQDRASSLPKNRFIKYIAMAALVFAVSATTALATYRISKPTIMMGRKKMDLSEVQVKYQKMIQPENPDVLAAKNEASAGYEGKYDIARVFAIYEYMIRKVKSEKISDDFEPREFGKTIRYGGDCKSKSVLFASILESIKGKTILIWMPPFGAFPGHMVVGVKVSHYPSDEKAKQLIALAIKDKYGDGPSPRFKDVAPSEGPLGTYLILDPVFRDMQSAYPGMTAISGDISKEEIIDSIPGKKGICPDL